MAPQAPQRTGRLVHGALAAMFVASSLVAGAIFSGVVIPHGNQLDDEAIMRAPHDPTLRSRTPPRVPQPPRTTTAVVIARCGESLDWIYDLVPGVDFYLYQKCSGRKRRVDRSALAARLPAGSTLAARQAPLY